MSWVNIPLLFIPSYRFNYKVTEVIVTNSGATLTFCDVTAYKSLVSAWETRRLSILASPWYTSMVEEQRRRNSAWIELVENDEMRQFQLSSYESLIPHLERRWQARCQQLLQLGKTISLFMVLSSLTALQNQT